MQNLGDFGHYILSTHSFPNSKYYKKIYKKPNFVLSKAYIGCHLNTTMIQ